MFLVSVHNYIPCEPVNGTELGYITLEFPTYGGGNVHVTANVRDGILDTGDIMVHLPVCAFVSKNRDMTIVP